jgi:LysM repeat protein
MAVTQPPPPPPTCTGVLHTVAAGETLDSIASSFGVTLEALVDANPQLITPGQILCVPVTPQICCLVLQAANGAPATAGGTGWVQQTPPNIVTTLVAAIQLPPPATFGPYTEYFARYVQPTGASFQFPLTPVTSAVPLVAGGITTPSGPLPSTTQVLVFPGTPAGAVGPVVLQGSLTTCH